MTRQPACHVCGQPGIETVPGTYPLARITSDCQPWKGKYRIGVCKKCGIVQTLVDSKWRADCEKIYRRYLIYPQTIGQAEQKVFSTIKRRLIPRSEAIVSHLQKSGFFKRRGEKILEIGAGAGFLLQQIGKAKAGRHLFAVEKSPDCVAKVRSLPGVKKVFSGLENVPSGFQQILLIHTLEHISDPVGYLEACRGKLDSAGLLFVQVPNSESNPFLLAVADHCTHFTLPSLKTCLEMAGFQCVHLTKLFGGKEIAGIFRPAVRMIRRRPSRANLAWLKAHVSTLRAVRATFLRLKKPVVLFGTSLGATWILSQFKRKVFALLDEDSARVGKKFMGLPIQHPSTLGRNRQVFSTVPFSRSNGLKSKLRHFRLLHAY